MHAAHASEAAHILHLSNTNKACQYARSCHTQAALPAAEAGEVDTGDDDDEADEAEGDDAAEELVNCYRCHGDKPPTAFRAGVKSCIDCCNKRSRIRQQVGSISLACSTSSACEPDISYTKAWQSTTLRLLCHGKLALPCPNVIDIKSSRRSFSLLAGA